MRKLLMIYGITIYFVSCRPQEDHGSLAACQNQFAAIKVAQSGYGFVIDTTHDGIADIEINGGNIDRDTVVFTCDGAMYIPNCTVIGTLYFANQKPTLAKVVSLQKIPRAYRDVYELRYWVDVNGDGKHDLACKDERELTGELPFIIGDTIYISSVNKWDNAIESNRPYWKFYTKI